MPKDIPIKEIVVEWHFEPKDYFEEKVLIKHDLLEIIIDSGLVKTCIPIKHSNDVDVLIEELTSFIESYFLGFQVVLHQKYKLSEPERYDLRENGGKNMYLNVGSFEGIGSLDRPEFVLKDSKGNIIWSSKKERVDEKKWFAETASKFRISDKILDQMLKSYAASVSDSNNELIHLYEVKDAVCTKFGSEKKAKKSLNFIKAEWNHLGRIANQEPISQGRHRGQNPGNLREATIAELNQAREVAKKIIKHYMKYLEEQSGL